MADFIRVASLNEISDPGSLLVEVDERLIVVFRVGKEFYALDDVCTHDGGPLSDGEMGDHWIACPRHGAKFDIRTGAALTMPATQATVAHEVKLDGDTIFVKINEG
jgi:3-phenylpropionate/trans-cinnamate dioxygenase ferredoxin component